MDRGQKEPAQTAALQANELEEHKTRIEDQQYQGEHTMSRQNAKEEE